MVLAALFAMDTGCPVKFMEDRVENFAAGDNHGEDRIYEAEVALDEEARIKGLRFKVIEDYGAYFLLGATGNSSPLSQAVGPYTIGAVGVEFIAVLTNKCGQGAYRGFGAAPMTFVLERLVDAAARETGLDVVEIRRRNLIPPEAFPYRTPVGNLYDSGDYPGALREALEVAEYEVWRRRQREWRKEGRYIGIGVVCAQERSVPSATELWLMYERRSAEPTTSAETVGCRVDAEGQVTLVLHSPSLGTANETVAAMVAAEELGLRPEAIRVCRVDSSLCGPAMGPAGSRMTVMLAGATSGAVLRVREKMRRIAAHILEVAEEDVEYLPGLQRFSVRGAPARFCEFHEVARYAHTRSLDLPAGLSSGLEATFTYEHPLASKPAVGDWGSFNPIIAHSVHIPVVEVDTETGFVSFLDYVVVHDCGTIINPKGVEGQILGGVCQGLGSALYEELVYEEGTGQLLTKTFYDYLVPTCVEMPRVRIFHRCTPSPFTYRGVKGAGEGGRIAAPAAIVAAIEDALAPFGVSVDEIPVTPEKIVRWIEASGLEAQ
jgi:CO/xanthine dehydrogenase Mo-binding subunit